LSPGYSDNVDKITLFDGRDNFKIEDFNLNQDEPDLTNFSIDQILSYQLPSTFDSTDKLAKAFFKVLDRGKFDTTFDANDKQKIHLLATDYENNQSNYVYFYTNYFVKQTAYVKSYRFTVQ
jgi:hypothetical protein